MVYFAIIIAIVLFVLLLGLSYLVLKAAVRNGMKEALEKDVIEVKPKK
ncbi:MAG: hypothetical protein LBL67_03570 [Coriobacteriales bacterium]|jgi:ABC-type lipoprotein release transport system permease subunit|nr:hypothetical protein [Coriobacteriales bacterium]